MLDAGGRPYSLMDTTNGSGSLAPGTHMPIRGRAEWANSLIAGWGQLASTEAKCAGDTGSAWANGWSVKSLVSGGLKLLNG